MEDGECLLMYLIKTIFLDYQPQLDGELEDCQNHLVYLLWVQEFRYQHQLKEVQDICHHQRRPLELIDCVEVYKQGFFVMLQNFFTGVLMRISTYFAQLYLI